MENKKKIKPKKISFGRRAGVLMPIFSLNGNYGIGDFGGAAFEFADILEEMGFSIWQILPLNPVGKGNSPYQSQSSFAGDEIYISLEKLHKENLIKNLPPKHILSGNRIDYKNVREFKNKYLKEAYINFRKRGEIENDVNFIKFSNKIPIKNYAIYKVFKKINNNTPWNKWDKGMKNYLEGENFDISPYFDDINYEIFIQYVFHNQWKDIKEYANSKKILIMGDIPIYAGFESQDVWEEKKAFKLNRLGNPIHFAGVPPDYFNKNGQNWQNPLYDWEYLKSKNYAYWDRKLKYSSNLYDIIRLDHFRGFEAYYSINAKNKTARAGKWIKGPGEDFFSHTTNLFSDIEIVAEDLGQLSEEVHKLRDDFSLKGMQIIQFEFELKGKKNLVIYTGTHDNQTICSWFEGLKKDKRDEILAAFKKKNLISKNQKNINISELFFRYAISSKADYAIFPVQDIVGLSDEARINTPGTINNENWSYRFNSMKKFKEKTEKITMYISESKRLL